MLNGGFLRLAAQHLVTLICKQFIPARFISFEIFLTAFTNVAVL
jgi:hypothetical protein